jgi:2'-5' RNA ligase
VSASPVPHRLGATHRLFFALWPDRQGRAELARAFAAVAHASGEPVPAENLHVTLEFLGAVPATRIGELADVGASLALPATELHFDSLEWWRHAAALVARAAAPPELLEVQAELRRELGARGFRVDARAFRPHVTLARRVTTAPALASVADARVAVRELALLESTSSPRGVRYVPLASWSR